MSKTLTKAQLAAELEALRVAYQHVSAERDALLRVQRSSRPAPQAQPVSQPLSAYRQTLARARALAMSTGRCVRVGDV